MGYNNKWRGILLKHKTFEGLKIGEEDVKRLNRDIIPYSKHGWMFTSECPGFGQVLTHGMARTHTREA